MNHNNESNETTALTVLYMNYYITLFIHFYKETNLIFNFELICILYEDIQDLYNDLYKDLLYKNDSPL